MREQRRYWTIACLLGAALLVQCGLGPARAEPEEAPRAKSRPLSFVGKLRDQPVQPTVYEALSPDSVPWPLISAELATALQHQYQLLDYARSSKHRLPSDLTVDKVDLIRTVQLLERSQHTYPFWLKDRLQLYRLWGEDQRTNVRFTGYYSPVLEVSETRSPIYRYPVYKRPRDWEGSLPTRREIEAEGALDTLDLVIGWARNKFDVYLMQIQGSGYVEYPDGVLSFFSYDGTNRHPYRSMEKFLRGWEGPQPKLYTLDGIQRFFDDYPDLVDTVLFQNPSYTFFKPSRGEPHGAGAVPLTPEISIAVDPRFIPLGSCLLAAVPVYDPELRRVTRHDYRIILAQDVGGAIKGPGHVDLYTGAGRPAKERASSLHHYGQLYLILPKKAK